MSADQTADPYGGYWFTLKIDDIGHLGHWQTCSGLQIEYDLQTWNEGGSNDFSWRLPSRAKNATNVKLTRAIVDASEAKQVVRYLHAVTKRMSQGVSGFMPATIQLHHRDTSLPPIAWTLHNAFPVKWTGPTLDVNGKQVATETLEIAYHGLTCGGA